MTLVEKTLEGTFWAGMSGIGGLLLGYGWGHVYAKFAGLPVGQVAKVNAIIFAANMAIASFVQTMTEGMKYRGYIQGGVSILLQSATIFELRRRGFMGDKLLILYTISLIFTVVVTVFSPQLIEWVEKLKAEKEAAKKV